MRSTVSSIVLRAGTWTDYKGERNLNRSHKCSVFMLENNTSSQITNCKFRHPHILPMFPAKGCFVLSLLSQTRRHTEFLEVASFFLSFVSVK